MKNVNVKKKNPAIVHLNFLGGFGFGLLFFSIFIHQENFVTKPAAALVVVGPTLSPGKKGSPVPQPPFCHTEMHK